MLELLTYIINSIVEEGDKVKITPVEEDESTIVFNIEAPEEYRGRIIGKGGMNIKSIRNLVSIIARREDKRVYIKIVD